MHMGRPAVRGKEIITYGDDELIGINLGYNYYVEFENGTHNMIESIWGRFNDSLGAYCESLFQVRRYIKRHKKLLSNLRAAHMQTLCYQIIRYV